MKTLGRYELLGELARGGMGVVFRARDPHSEREVALKVALPGSATEAQQARQAKRFQTEAHVLTRLEHPNVVPVLDSGHDPRGDYLVLELIEGTTLAELIEDGPLPQRRAAEIALALAQGLTHVHEHGVLHRDIKPANVLMTHAGTPMLTDFGLAKDLDGSLGQSAATVDGAFLGSPGFLAPEQAHGKVAEIGPAADVYGLGATLYAMLTGVAPFQADSLVELIAAMQRRPDDPHSVRPGLDRSLSRICMQCLERRPSDRIESAAALAAALEGYLYGRSSEPAGSAGRFPIAAASGLLLVTAIGIAALATHEQSRLPQEPRAESAESAPDADPATPQAPAKTPAATPLAGDDLKRQLKTLALRVADLRTVGRRDDALAVQEQALALDPDNPRLLDVRGELLLELGRYPEAIQAFDRVLALDATQIQARYNRGTCNYESQRFAEAAEDYKQVVAENPRAVLAWRALGRALAADDKRKQALGAYDEALALEPNSPLLYLERARLWEPLDQAKARADYDACVARDPNNADAYFERATLRDDQGDGAGAIADYTEVLRIRPNLAGALYNRGLAREQNRDLEGALKDYSAALEQDPNDAKTLVNRGFVLRRLDKLNAAEADYTAAIQADPTYFNAWAARAQLRYARKDYAGSERDFGEALKLDPRPIVRVNRALARKQLGDLAGAREELEAVLADTPGDDRQAVRARKLLKTLDGS